MRTGENTRVETAMTSIHPRKTPSPRTAESLQDDVEAFEPPTPPGKSDVRPSIAASDRTDEDKDLPPDKTYICRICGNTFVGRPPRQCPICGASEEEFELAR